MLYAGRFGSAVHWFSAHAWFVSKNPDARLAVVSNMCAVKIALAAFAEGFWFVGGSDCFAVWVDLGDRVAMESVVLRQRADPALHFGGNLWVKIKSTHAF